MKFNSVNSVPFLSKRVTLYGVEEDILKFSPTHPISVQSYHLICVLLLAINSYSIREHQQKTFVTLSKFWMLRAEVAGDWGLNESI